MKLMTGVIAALVILCQTTLARAEGLRLLMFEQPGCIYCEKWNADVSPEYPLTDEGRAAPLQRVGLRDPLAEGITLRSPPVFTPTFVLVRDGVELGRIEGYPGEDFFWGLLGQMIAEAQKDGA